MPLGLRGEPCEIVPLPRGATGLATRGTSARGCVAGCAGSVAAVAMPASLDGGERGKVRAASALLAGPGLAARTRQPPTAAFSQACRGGASGRAEVRPALDTCLLDCGVCEGAAGEAIETAWRAIVRSLRA